MKKGILALALVLCIPLAHANEPEEVVVYGVDLMCSKRCYSGGSI